MNRFFAVDYGAKRIGLAVGDDHNKIATPVKTVESRGTLDDQIEAVVAVASAFDVDAFVVGLPYNMDDTEGEQAKRTRRFGDALGRSTGKPVHYFDERLSSHAAREMLRPAELTRKKRKAVQDAVAAQIILQTFLDTRQSD